MSRQLLGLAWGLSILAGVTIIDAEERARGNVTALVRQNGGDQQLVITGDGEANHIVVCDLKNTRFVAGVNGTLVNHQPIVHFSKRNLVDTRIDMGPGDDQVMVATAIVGESEFEAEGGLGNDLFRARETISVAGDVKLTGFETIIPPESDASAAAVNVNAGIPLPPLEGPAGLGDEPVRHLSDRRIAIRPVNRRL